MSPKRYAQAACVLFAGEALFAAVHLALGANYTPHYTHATGVVIDLVLAVVWITAAVASLTPLTWPAPFLMICGAAATALQGFIFTLATNPTFGPLGAGIPFFVAAPVQFYCTFKAAPPLTPVVPQPASPPRRLTAWASALRLRHTH